MNEKRNDEYSRVERCLERNGWKRVPAELRVGRAETPHSCGMGQIGHAEGREGVGVRQKGTETLLACRS
jgi:hypothetical protein